MLPWNLRVAETLKSIQDDIEDEYCPKGGKEKCVYFQPAKTLKITSKTAKKAKQVVICSIFHSKNENQQWIFSVEMVHVTLPEKRVTTTKQKSRPLSPQNYLHQSQSVTTETEPKSQKSFRL